MPEPIGEPSGITAAQPTSSSRRARIGSSLVYGSTMKPSSTSSSAASSSATASGSNVRSSPTTSSLTQSVSNASRASFAVRTASRAVKQPAVFGQQPHAGAVEHVDDRAALARVDPPQRDGDQLASRRPRARRPARRASGTRRCRAAAASDSSVPAMVRTSVFVSVTAISASLDRAQDLHPRPLVQLRRVPLAARDDLGVDRDRDAAARARQVERLQARS